MDYIPAHPRRANAITVVSTEERRGRTVPGAVHVPGQGGSVEPKLAAKEETRVSKATRRGRASAKAVAAAAAVAAWANAAAHAAAKCCSAARRSTMVGLPGSERLTGRPAKAAGAREGEQRKAGGGKGGAVGKGREFKGVGAG